jgi:SAM-dependent methyltransferase
VSQAIDPTLRFSSRVQNYVKYRPGYPEQVIQVLVDACALDRSSIITDVGSGTGILSELFLRHGNRVFGVEPNAAMRAAAEELLAACEGFTSVAGRAEATTLPDDSVDIVTAGQAFHWFHREKARVEFQRILKQGGYVALVWNDRRSGPEPFMRAYEHLLRSYATDYTSVDHKFIGDTELAAFFGSEGYSEASFENIQLFDYEAVEGRLLSSSYAPEKGHPDHEPMLEYLREIVERYQSGGTIRFSYDTRVYSGRLT